MAWRVAVCCSVLRCFAVCWTLQHTAIYCNTLQQKTATHSNTLHHTTTDCTALQHTATHYNALQHAATHCNTLQHLEIVRQKKQTATDCNTLQHVAPPTVRSPEDTATADQATPTPLQHTATHCTTLQHTATHYNTLHHLQFVRQKKQQQLIKRHQHHCNTLQHTAKHCTTCSSFAKRNSGSWSSDTNTTATHCNTVQHTVTHCTTLQHTAPPAVRSPKETATADRATPTLVPADTISRKSALNFIYIAIYIGLFCGKWSILFMVSGEGQSEYQLIQFLKSQRSTSFT